MTFAYVLPQSFVAIPTVGTLIVGIVLMSVRQERLTARARTLGVTGCAVLLFGALVSVSYGALLPALAGRRPVAEIGLLAAGFSLVGVVINSVGIALLIASVLAGAAPGGHRPVGPFQPPAYGPQGRPAPPAAPNAGHQSDDPGWHPPTS